MTITTKNGGSPPRVSSTGKVRPTVGVLGPPPFSRPWTWTIEDYTREDRDKEFQGPQTGVALQVSSYSVSHETRPRNEVRRESVPKHPFCHVHVRWLVSRLRPLPVPVFPRYPHTPDTILRLSVLSRVSPSQTPRHSQLTLKRPICHRLCGTTDHPPRSYYPRSLVFSFGPSGPVH